MSPLVHAYVIDPLERAVATFVQQFVVIILPAIAAFSISNADFQPWLKAADIAGYAAILSLITSILTFSVPKLPVLWDIVWRTVKTFLQSMFGVLAADQLSPGTVHAGWLMAVGVAIPVALAALVKSLAALAAPWSEGASLAPAPNALP